MNDWLNEWMSEWMPECTWWGPDSSENRWSPSRCLMASTMVSRFCLEVVSLIWVRMYCLKKKLLNYIRKVNMERKIGVRIRRKRKFCNFKQQFWQFFSANLDNFIPPILTIFYHLFWQFISHQFWPIPSRTRIATLSDDLKVQWLIVPGSACFWVLNTGDLYRLGTVVRELRETGEVFNLHLVPVLHLHTQDVDWLIRKIGRWLIN